MRQKIYSGFLFCILSLVSHAQDIHLTQLFTMPTYLNPAFAGSNVCGRFTLNYRDQWSAFDKGYVTRMAGFDHSIGRSPWGIGALVAQDEAGLGGLKTTLIQSFLAYEVRFNKNMSLRMALQPGIGMKSINYERLTFGDQMFRGGNVATVEEIPTPRTYFDIGTGAIFSYKNYWAGTSLQHLNRPNESLYNALDGRLPLLYSFHGGTRFDLSPDEREAMRKQYVTLVMNYHGQAKFDQVDVGAYLTKSFYTIGLWYRGIPVLKHYAPGYPNNDQIAIILGLHYKKMKIGYSYDNTISYLAGLSKGAHEVSLSFQVCTTKYKKRRLALISCPKF